MSDRLETFQLELIAQMFNKRVIRTNYLPIETIAKFCRWKTISRKHGGGRIKKVIRELAKLGLIDLHGKGIVASLTSDGVLVARDYLQI